MSTSDRISNGWEVAKTSLRVLSAHKELIIFPILSGISMTIVVASFLGITFNVFGWPDVGDGNTSRSGLYLAMFVFYIVNYFVVVFFNMALMHAAKLYFDGEEVSVSKALQFSVSRIHYIFLWAVFAATVGVVLGVLRDKLGWVGKLLIGAVGIVWSVATFLVVPVLAYENLSPWDALKRSGVLVKDKWGEGITANFSLGLIAFAAIIIAAFVSMGVSALVNEQAGIIIAAIALVFIIAIGSALKSIVISAIYNQVNGNLNDHLNKQLLDKLFVQK